jgi:hypothetical protein
VPYAFFGLGEIAFAEALTNPQEWYAAGKFYGKAADALQSPIAPFALGRLDVVCERAGGRPAAPGNCAGAAIRSGAQVAGDEVPK